MDASEATPARRYRLDLCSRSPSGGRRSVLVCLLPHHVPLSSFAAAQPENGFLLIEPNDKPLTDDEQQHFAGHGYPEMNYAISKVS